MYVPCCGVVAHSALLAAFSRKREEDEKETSRERLGENDSPSSFNMCD